eukprot:scaffold119488_cov16-Tisochrysis_lutea.AAC.3
MQGQSEDASWSKEAPAVPLCSIHQTPSPIKGARNGVAVQVEVQVVQVKVPGSQVPSTAA